MIYGYARVSTAAQDYEGQVEKLKAAGCDHVFAEARSGAHRRKRPELAKVMAALEPGDTLVVVSLSRFARSAQDALNHMATVLAQGADFRSLGEPWSDTATPAGRLMATIFMGFAEFDREMILQRTAEGRQRARSAGVKMGRPPKLSSRQRTWAVLARQEDPPKQWRDVAGVLGVSVATAKRVVAGRQASEEAATAAEQADLEDLLRQQGHLPKCAIFTSGRGAPVRCTCGRGEDPKV